MKTKTHTNNVIGYIEGYYGNLLSWESRTLIIKSLCKNNLNTYFYAPKEDKNHRLCWKEQYGKEWRLNFQKFTNIGKKYNVDIIAGIAPGLDFNFKQLNEKRKSNQKSDFEFLLTKAKKLLEDGATSIALLLDDIPADFKDKFGNKVSEGTYHGKLANRLLKKLGKKIFFVPRIYADELIEDEPNYLSDLSKVLDPEIIVFYCGKNVVSKSLTGYRQIEKVLENKIIFWDNYYANDYCPRRLFIGPYLGRKNIKNVMINPTGLINTDLLILDIFGNNLNGKINIKEWEKLLNLHGVPKSFIKVKKYFLKPDFGSDPTAKRFNIEIKDLETLDLLLWKWKGDLSREWYPFLFGLKQDLQIYKNLLTSERKMKTQTAPLSKFLIKGEM